MCRSKCRLITPALLLAAAMLVLSAAGPQAVHAANTCNGQLSIDYGALDPNFAQVGDVYHVTITLGTASITGGTKMTLNRFKFELDCDSVGVPCTDAGTAPEVAYEGDSTITTTCGVGWTTGHDASGTPNELTFTPSVPLDINADTPNFCTVSFNVKITSLAGTAILQAVGFSQSSSDALCDNELASGSQQSGSIQECPATCADANLCTQEACDQTTGQCVTTSTTTCNDNNVCTSEQCNSTTGQCETTSTTTCNDNDACTADSCDPIAGCIHTDICVCTPTVSCVKLVSSPDDQDGVPDDRNVTLGCPVKDDDGEDDDGDDDGEDDQNGEDDDGEGVSHSDASSSVSGDGHDKKAQKKAQKAQKKAQKKAHSKHANSVASSSESGDGEDDDGEDDGEHDGEDDDGEDDDGEEGGASEVTFSVTVTAGECDLVNVTISDPLLVELGCLIPAPFALSANTSTNITLCTLPADCSGKDDDENGEDDDGEDDDGEDDGEDDDGEDDDGEDDDGEGVTHSVATVTRSSTESGDGEDDDGEDDDGEDEGPVVETNVITVTAQSAVNGQIVTSQCTATVECACDDDGDEDDEDDEDDDGDEDDEDGEDHGEDDDND